MEGELARTKEGDGRSFVLDGRFEGEPPPAAGPGPSVEDVGSEARGRAARAGLGLVGVLKTLEDSAARGGALEEDDNDAEGFASALLPFAALRRLYSLYLAAAEHEGQGELCDGAKAGGGEGRTRTDRGMLADVVLCRVAGVLCAECAFPLFELGAEVGHGRSVGARDGRELGRLERRDQGEGDVRACPENLKRGSRDGQAGPEKTERVLNSRISNPSE